MKMTVLVWSYIFFSLFLTNTKVLSNDLVHNVLILSLNTLSVGSLSFLTFPFSLGDSKTLVDASNFGEVCSIYFIIWEASVEHLEERGSH